MDCKCQEDLRWNLPSQVAEWFCGDHIDGLYEMSWNVSLYKDLYLPWLSHVLK